MTGIINYKKYNNGDLDSFSQTQNIWLQLIKRMCN